MTVMKLNTEVPAYYKREDGLFICLLRSVFTVIIFNGKININNVYLIRDD